MRTSVLLLAASAALASAQVTYDEATGIYHCSKPNAAFCAGDSLKTDIIIRCNAAGIGQPGRCSNNLAGQPPVGAKPALCYQPDATSGGAACAKNCIVYNDNGSTFTLPAALCTPSEPQPTTTITYINPSPKPPTNTITFFDPTPTGKPNGNWTRAPEPTTTVTTTITYIDDSGVLCTTTYTQPNGPHPTQPVTTTTITYVDNSGVTCTTTLWQPIPPTTLSTTYVHPTGSGHGGYNNGTCFSCHPGQGGNNGGDGGKTGPTPTKVPDGAGPSRGGGKPDQASSSGSSSRPTGVVTSGAVVNGVSGAAVMAMVAAFLL